MARGLDSGEIIDVEVRGESGAGEAGAKLGRLTRE